MQKRVLPYILFSILLTGCTPYTTHDNNPPTIEILLYGPYPKKGLNESQYDISIKKMPNAGSENYAKEATTTAYAVLEAAARTVLKHGKRYFSIDYPKGLSSTQGSKIHDLKTFQDACVENSILQATSAIHTKKSYACGISQRMKNDLGFTIRNSHASILYVMYRTAPKNRLTWDAKKLLSDMKREGLLVPKSYEWMDRNTHQLLFKE